MIHTARFRRRLQTLLKLDMCRMKSLEQLLWHFIKKRKKNCF